MTFMIRMSSMWDTVVLQCSILLGELWWNVCVLSSEFLYPMCAGDV